MLHTVKRHGHSEEYDEKKVYASVYAAALNCHLGEAESEKIALTVMKKVNAWVKNRKAFTSDQIRDIIISTIDNEDITLMYKHHLDLC